MTKVATAARAATKDTDVSDRTSEGTASREAPRSHDANAKRPLWSRTFNRVDCSVWGHEQNGEVRFTVSISRSYLEKKSNTWKRNFYFDAQDLVDVKMLCDLAEEYILKRQGMVPSVEED
jgi:hypothetical protein